MAHGLSLFKNTGSQSWSSEDYPFVIVGSVFFDINTADGTVWSFPKYTGHLIAIFGNTPFIAEKLIISYPNSIPTITLSKGSTWFGAFSCVAQVYCTNVPSGGSYGIKVFNASSSLSLDEQGDYHCYAGSFSTSRFTGTELCGCGLNLQASLNDKGYRATIPRSSFPNPPLIFMDLATYPNLCAIGSTFYDSNYWYPTVYSTVANPTIYAFGRASEIPVSSTTQFGMRIFDANGAAIFSSEVHSPLSLTHPLVLPNIYEPAWLGSNSTAWPTVYNTDQTYTVQKALPSNTLIGSLGRIRKGLTTYSCKIGTNACRWWHHAWSRYNDNLRLSDYLFEGCVGTLYCSNGSYSYQTDFAYGTTTMPFRSHILITNKDYYI